MTVHKKLNEWMNEWMNVWNILLPNSYHNNKSEHTKQQLQNMVTGSNRIAYLVKVGPKHRN